MKLGTPRLLAALLALAVVAAGPALADDPGQGSAPSWQPHLTTSGNSAYGQFHSNIVGSQGFGRGFGSTRRLGDLSGVPANAGALASYAAGLSSATASGGSAKPAAAKPAAAVVPVESMTSMSGRTPMQALGGSSGAPVESRLSLGRTSFGYSGYSSGGTQVQLNVPSAAAAATAATAASPTSSH